MEKMTERQKKELIKRIEKTSKPQGNTYKKRKEMYLEQTDRNYKDGDRN